MQQSPIILLSPAKLNLFFYIERRRPDGYHEIASLYQAIDLYDTLSFTRVEQAAPQQDSLTCSDPEVPLNSSNLIFKATELFRYKTALPLYLNIALNKKIPMRAGLGGGSGNAATTLWAMNKLAGFLVEHNQLMAWAGEIGSDCSFFLSQGSAYCTGRGELIKQIAPLNKTTLWVVKPQEGLSTPRVYQTFRQKLRPQRDPKAALQRFLDKDPCYFNDLELPALSLLPSLAVLKTRLLECGFHTVVLTGSGTAFFCLGEGVIPPALNVFSQRVNFLNRKEHAWYGAEHC